MYYLEQKQFKPAMILFGIPFIPCIIGLVIANILLNKIELLVILSIIIGVYLIIVIILWKLYYKFPSNVLFFSNFNCIF